MTARIEAMLRSGPTSARMLRRAYGLLPHEVLQILRELGAERYDKGGKVYWRLK
jgi:hypothetical protein